MTLAAAAFVLVFTAGPAIAFDGTAFVEGRYVATELDQIMLLGGMTFSFSRGPVEAEF